MTRISQFSPFFFLFMLIFSNSIFAQDNFCSAVRLEVNATFYNHSDTNTYNTGATIEANEPIMSNVIGDDGIQATVWYSFYTTPEGIVSLSTDFVKSTNKNSQMSLHLRHTPIAFAKPNLSNLLDSDILEIDKIAEIPMEIQLQLPENTDLDFQYLEQILTQPNKFNIKKIILKRLKFALFRVQK